MHEAGRSSCRRTTQTSGPPAAPATSAGGLTQRDRPSPGRWRALGSICVQSRVCRLSVEGAQSRSICAALRNQSVLSSGRTGVVVSAPRRAAGPPGRIACLDHDPAGDLARPTSLANQQPDGGCRSHARDSHELFGVRRGGSGRLAGAGLGRKVREIGLSVNPGVPQASTDTDSKPLSWPAGRWRQGSHRGLRCC